MNLKENERIDELGCNNLKIIQNKNWFCFGIDSVLLVNFAKNIKENSTILDLGTGTGIIPILLSGKINIKKAVGIEIQENVADMAKRSVELNNLQNKIEIICSNILNLNNNFFIEKGLENKFDVIITNPPYKKKGEGVINEKEEKLISRHEITADLEDFIKVSSNLLKDKGEFYIVHRPERLVDILDLMRKYKIEPKLMRMVCSNYNKPPKLVLIKGIRNAKPFLKIQNNLYIYDEKNNYTEEIKKIYNN